MKLTLIYFSSLFIVLASCGSVKDKVEEHFDARLIVSDSSKVELYSYNELDTSVLIMEYQYFKFDSITSKGSLPYHDSVNQLVVSFIESITSFESFDTTAKISTTFFDNALMKFADYYRSDVYEGDAPVWYFESSSTIENDFVRFSQISNWTWAYTGGAHGNGFSAYQQVDKTTGKELILDDFISNIQELTTIVDTIFRKENELTFKSNLEEEGYWFDDGLFKLNENFLFEEGKMIFVYNAYEIAPYSAGSITIEVPLKKISHLLKTKLSYKEN